MEPIYWTTEATLLSCSQLTRFKQAKLSLLAMTAQSKCGTVESANRLFRCLAQSGLWPTTNSATSSLGVRTNRSRLLPEIKAAGTKVQTTPSTTRTASQAPSLKQAPTWPNYQTSSRKLRASLWAMPRVKSRCLRTTEWPRLICGSRSRESGRRSERSSTKMQI